MMLCARKIKLAGIQMRVHLVLLYLRISCRLNENFAFMKDTKWNEKTHKQTKKQE